MAIEEHDLGSEDEFQPESQVKLIAYEHSHPVDLSVIRRASPQRDWMDATTNRFAYRCLPLVIANQAGWLMHCPFTFRAHWSGGQAPNAITIQVAPNQKSYGPNPPEQYVATHFGSGVLTFILPYLFQTSPGYNLWVKGPTNIIKDGIQALEGMVETDWAHATFTMNWKFTRPNVVVQFDQGEPFCQLLPYPRGLLESVQPVVKPIETNPDLHTAFVTWSQSRAMFNQDLKKPGSEAQKARWQKDYHQGKTAEGVKFPSHQTRLIVREFERDDTP